MTQWRDVARGVVVLALAVVPAGCSTSTVVFSDCGPKPEGEGCFDACTGFAIEPTCIDGAWVCVSERLCPDECGPLPGGVDCVDACGNFTLPSCEDGSWTCPELTDECQDPSLGGAVWSSSLGGDAYERAHDIAVDGDGNVYVLGSFQETLEGASGQQTSLGGYDIFIAKYSADGVPLWRIQRGGAGDDLGISLGVELGGALVITGTEAATAGHPAVVGDLFMAKLSPGGDPIWEVDFGLQHDGLYDAHNLAVDGFGNITLVGQGAQGDVIGVPLSSDGVFAARFNPTGQHVWTQSFSTGLSAAVTDVSSDLLGNTFVTGMFSGDVVLGASALSASGTSDAFLMALDENGTPTWARGFGAAPMERSLGWRVAADGTGGVALSGAFGTTIQIDGMLYGNGPRTAFVALFDPSGASRWAHAIEGASDTISGLDRWSVAVDEVGHVIVGGHFEGDNNVTIPAVSAGDYDILLARYTLSGDLDWGWSLGDDNTEVVTAGASGPGQTTAVLGEFWGAPDLGAGKLESHAEGAIFVALFDEDGRR